MSRQKDFLDNAQAIGTTASIYKAWRERLVTPMLIGILILGLIALVPALISAQSILLDMAFIAIYLLVALATVVGRSYSIRMGIVIFAIYALALSELLSTGILGDSLFLFLAFVVFATMMFSPRAGITATFISLLTYGLTAWLSLSGWIGFINPKALPANVMDWLSASALTILFAFIIIVGFRRLEHEFAAAEQRVASTLGELQNERKNLEDIVAKRTHLLQKINELGQAISSILDPDELHTKVVHRIGEEFDCYYTALFLLDGKGQWAELKQATGDAGDLLEKNGFRVNISSRSIIALVLSSKQPRLIPDPGEESVQFDNPLLPYTRSEMVLPLIIGEKAIGALDLQSTKEQAFGADNLDTFQSMANQISIALENARLFQEAQQNLAELRATQRQYLQDAWASFAAENEIEYALGEEDMNERGNRINVPIALREQFIGQISMTQGNEWSAEQQSLVEAIATQAALALENARLVKESQAAATHERLVTDITKRIRSANTIDGILQAAVMELGRALNVSEAVIELRVDGEGASENE